MNPVVRSKIFGTAHLAWFKEPLLGPNDRGPVKRHYAVAALKVLADNNFRWTLAAKI